MNGLRVVLDNSFPFIKKTNLLRRGENMEYLLEMTNIEKTFGNVKALTNGNLQLGFGEVHALLGANGAGKSTLIKILSGMYTPTAGDITLENEAIHFKSSRDAKDLGIFTVYQEVDIALAPDLTVAENIMLDTFATAKIFVSTKKLQREAQKALDKLQVKIDLNKKIMELTLAEKQLILIARALVKEAKIIIFDEPTAPLSITEADKLFTVINTLKERNVSSIFISHRLHEVYEICDQVTVMREGKHVVTKSTKDITQDEIIEAMLGKAIEEMSRHKNNQNIGDEILELVHISDGNKVKDVSMSVHKSEIVGVVGLVGAGKTELAKLLYGETKKTTGTINLKQKEIKFKHPSEAIKSGVVLVPEERRKEGLFIEESIYVNTSFSNLNKFSKWSFMKKKKEQTFAKSIIEQLKVKTQSTNTELTNLSGGNQQKIAIGKWFSHDADIFLFDEPTKGVDIGAKVDIFEAIRNIVANEKSVIYFSSEIQEVLNIADRIYVMYDGELVKELSPEEATQEKILIYASGGKEE